jgi:hypothetical protein
METTNDAEMSAVAHAEVQRQLREWGGRRDDITRQLAACCQAKSAAGTPSSVPMSDETKRVRELAREWMRLEGYTPSASLQEDGEDPEPRLQRERAAVDLILAELRKKGLETCAALAASWIIKNTPAWVALAHDIVLAGVRLQELERRAADMLQELPMPGYRMPLTEFLGRGHSIMEAGGDNPLRLLLRAAVEEGLVTSGEIRKVQNAAQN